MTDPRLTLIPGRSELNRPRQDVVELDGRSRRPGVAHEHLPLHLDPSAAGAVASAAAADGLPPALWAVLAIESQRALDLYAAPEHHEQLAEMLDHAAATGELDQAAAPMLAAYAIALRGARRRRATGFASQRLDVFVPYHSHIAWTQSAESLNMPLAAFARRALTRTPRGRGLWEAAAAEQGQFLAEWIATRMLGRARSSVSVARLVRR